MKNIAIAAILALLFLCPASAQQTLLGKYSGTYARGTGSRQASIGVSLEIISVDGDTVMGKATIFPSGGRGAKYSCAGEYQVVGKVKGDVLDLGATEKGGAVEDCGMRLRLTVEGNKLVGTINKSDIQLSK